ncbi:hypothetical protein [Caudoviricetes sp.]|nr:hypothetical protein [Caudoviricetes sp.]
MDPVGRGQPVTPKHLWSQLHPRTDHPCDGFAPSIVGH